MTALMKALVVEENRRTLETYELRVVLKNGHIFQGAAYAWKQGDPLKLDVASFNGSIPSDPNERTLIDPADIAAITILPC